MAQAVRLVTLLLPGSSTPHMVPVLSPTPNQQLNWAVQLGLFVFQLGSLVSRFKHQAGKKAEVLEGKRTKGFEPLLPCHLYIISVSQALNVTRTLQSH